MKLQTPVEIQPSNIKITPEDRIMILGSCFADNMGEKMKNAGFDVCVNPFGTLYNPVSIANSLSRLKSGIHFTERECVEMGAGADLVCSFSHHTSFARPTAEEFLATANRSLEDASIFWNSCNKVIITLGTIFCYVHDGSVVTNCLKRPAGEFTRAEMTLQQTASILHNILVYCPDREFIFTVSPIRHLGDGAHMNQISKSTLLLAADHLLRDENVGQRCAYFPSYELVLDELRDYRFYTEDMTHPTAQTVNYIWEKFRDFAVPVEWHGKISENEKIWRQSQHRRILHND